MSRHLIAGYLPDDYDPSVQSEEAVAAIYALNAEIEAAGALKFA